MKLSAGILKNAMIFILKYCIYTQNINRMDELAYIILYDRKLRLLCK